MLEAARSSRPSRKQERGQESTVCTLWSYFFVVDSWQQIPKRQVFVLYWVLITFCTAVVWWFLHLSLTTPDWVDRSRHCHLGWQIGSGVRRRYDGCVVLAPLSSHLSHLRLSWLSITHSTSLVPGCFDIDRVNGGKLGGEMDWMLSLEILMIQNVFFIYLCL